MNGNATTTGMPSLDKDGCQAFLVNGDVAYQCRYQFNHATVAHLFPPIPVPASGEDQSGKFH